MNSIIILLIVFTLIAVRHIGNVWLQIYALHSKLFMLDESACNIGGANVTETGLKSNFEIGVVIRGKKVRPILKLLNKLWDGSKSATLNDIEHYTT